MSDHPVTSVHPCRKKGLERPTAGWCIHGACRPQGPVSEELKRMEPVILPHYTATLTVRRDGGETVVHAVITGPPAAVALAVRSVADAFEEEVTR